MKVVKKNQESGFVIVFKDKKLKTAHRKISRPRINYYHNRCSFRIY